MSDFGTDVGNSALSMTQKLTESILRLFAKIISEISRQLSAEHRLKKMELKTAKTKAEREKILSEIPNKKGLYNWNKLQKSGLPLSPVGINMTQEEMKSFSERMEREGIIFTALKNKKDNFLDFSKPRTYEITVLTQDLDRVAELVEKINDEKVINIIDSRIDEIIENGEENISDQDRVDLDSLRQQKEAIQRKYCDELNLEQTAKITEEAVYGYSKRGMTFNQAMDRNTGRALDKDLFCIVADANDPTKYIRCHAYMDEYKEKPYIRTDYEVFRGSEKVYQTHDGRFDNRPMDYWITEKDKMKEAGEFGDTLFKFYDYTEYQKWAEEVKEQNDRELSTMDKNSVQKDYKKIIASLEKQLDENGAYFKEGAIFKKENDNVLSLNDEMSEEEKAINGESAIIGKQINNYMELETLDTELTVAQVELTTAEDGTPAKAEAQARYEQIKSKYDKAVDIERDLIMKRKNINAVQAEQIRKNIGTNKDIKDLNSQDKGTFKMKEVKDEIKKRRENNQKTSFAKDKPSVNKSLAKNVKER